MIDVTKLFVVTKRMTLSIGKVQIIKFKYLLNTINIQILPISNCIKVFKKYVFDTVTILGSAKL